MTTGGRVMAKELSHACQDGPDNDVLTCKLLMAAHRMWTVWREQQQWHARHDEWPVEVMLTSPNVELLYKTISQIEERS